MRLNYFALYVDRRNKETEKAIICSGGRPAYRFCLIMNEKGKAVDADIPEHASKGCQ